MYPNGRAFVAKARQWHSDAVVSIAKGTRVSAGFESAMLALEDTALMGPRTFTAALKSVFDEIGEQAMMGAWEGKSTTCEKAYVALCTQGIKKYLHPILFASKAANESDRIAVYSWLVEDVLGVGCSDKAVVRILRTSRDILDIFAIPVKIEDGQVIETNRKIVASLAVDGDKGFRAHFGDQYALRISQLRTSSGQLFQGIMERAKDLMKKDGVVKFSFLQESTSTFSEWLFGGCPMRDEVQMETIDAAIAWVNNVNSMTQAVEFAKDGGDDILEAEVYFFENVRQLVVPLAKLVKKIRESDTRGARRITQDWSTLARELRTAHSRFSLYLCTLADTKLALFRDSPGRMYVSMGNIDASEWWAKLLSNSSGLLLELGQIWTTDLADVTQKLQSWCPDWEPKQDVLLDKASTSLVLEMCKNPNY